MFDDPKKELHRLDEELRAESYEEQLEKLQSQEIPTFEDLDEEDDDWLEEVDQLLSEEPENSLKYPGIGRVGGRRNDAVDFHRTVYSDEENKKDAAVFVEKKQKKKKEEKKRGKDEKKSDSVGCLPFIIFLELVGISGMLWWWYRWMR